MGEGLRWPPRNAPKKGLAGDCPLVLLHGRRRPIDEVIPRALLIFSLTGPAVRFALEGRGQYNLPREEPERDRRGNLVSPRRFEVSWPAIARPRAGVGYEHRRDYVGQIIKVSMPQTICPMEQCPQPIWGRRSRQAIPPSGIAFA